MWICILRCHWFPKFIFSYWWFGACSLSRRLPYLVIFCYGTKMRVSNFSDLNLPLHYYQYLQKKPIAKEWLKSSVIYAMSNMLYARVQICNSGGTMEDRSAPLSTPSHPLMALPTSLLPLDHPQHHPHYHRLTAIFGAGSETIQTIDVFAAAWPHYNGL